MAFLTTLSFLVLLGTSVAPAAAQSGSGTSTRYWDCCKPSCAWPMAGITSPVMSCDASDKPLKNAEAASGNRGGTAYMCSDQTPWAINDDLAYGFAAVGGGSPQCCACYQLTFTSTVLQGKKMIVQATNTGNDLSSTHFDLAIPGGGFGEFDSCSKQWPNTQIWGARYGGTSSDTCNSLPAALQPGCAFRWGWMAGSDNPNVDWEVVTCPAELVAKSNCSVTGYNSAYAPSTPASSVAAPAKSSVAPAHSESVQASSSAAPAVQSSTAPVYSASVPASSAAAPAQSSTAPKYSPSAPASSSAVPIQSSTAPAHSPHAPIISAPPMRSPIEDSIESFIAVYVTTTLAPVIVHVSPDAVPRDGSLPDESGEEGPIHRHRIRHRHLPHKH